MPFDVGGDQDAYYETSKILESLAMRSFIDQCTNSQGKVKEGDYTIHPLMSQFIRKSIIKDGNIIKVYFFIKIPRR